MTTWGLYGPSATVNYVANPSMETGLTGWSGRSTATLERTPDAACWGAYGLRVSSPGNAQGEGAEYLLTNHPGVGLYTVSVWVRAQTAGAYELRVYSVAGGDWARTTQILEPGVWTRLVLDAWLDASQVITIGDVHEHIGAYVLDIDGLQVETDALTRYCDGDQPGCIWAGLPHASISSRAGSSLVSVEHVFGLNGQLLITATQGELMPPLAQVPVATRLRGVQAQPRAMQVTVQLKAPAGETIETVRRLLVDRLHLARNEPLTWVYRAESGRGVLLRARYKSGLESMVSAVTSAGVVRLSLEADDPYWYDEVGHAALLSVADREMPNLTGVTRRLGSADGIWAGMGDPAAEIACLALAGSRLLAGGTTGVLVWDAQAGTWTALGAVGGVVTSLAGLPDGTVYAGGDFGIKYWDGTTWTSLGTSPGSTQALALGWNGTVYAGGDYGCKAWNDDTDTWDAVGTDEPNGAVYALVIGEGNRLYAGGAFTTPGNRAAMIDLDTGTAWEGLSGAWEPDGDVRALAWLRNGTLALGGAFTGLIRAWTGSVFRELGSGGLSGGTSPVVRSLAGLSNGLLAAGGQFTHAGDRQLRCGLAYWTQSRWQQADLDLSDLDHTVMALLEPPENLDLGQLLVAGPVTSTPGSSVQRVVTNTGMAPTPPCLMLTNRLGGGVNNRVWAVVNETTGARLDFDLAVLPHETIWLELHRDRRRFWSDARGHLWATLLGGTVLDHWLLVPGDNRISLFAEIGIDMVIQWTPRHWTLDGVTDAV